MAAGGSGFNSGEIEARANAAVDTIVPRLFSSAVQAGAFWELGSIDGERGRTLKINRTGPRIGLWNDFNGADQDGGDMVKLVAMARFGGLGREAFADAYRWLKSLLGLDGLDPDRIKAVKREIAEDSAKRDAEAEKIEREKRSRAQWLWKGAVPIRGTPAQRYLEGRGIDFDRLGGFPGALGYHPACGHPETKGKKWPAMIAGIWRAGCGSRPIAIHRTYLDLSHGKAGPVTKMKHVRDAKLTLGQFTGGYIPLTRGASDRKWRDMLARERVYAAEGIENALSVAMGDPARRTCAGVSLSGLGGLILPDQAGPLVICNDNDPLGSKAHDALERAIARQQETRGDPDLVELLPPPPQFKDWNDVLMGKERR